MTRRAPQATRPARLLSGALTLRVAALAALGTLGAGTALAQTFPNLPITPGQRATAQQVAQAGVPLSELSPNAPDSYTVKRGDTLWGISGLFLKSPWRWPELWGMNMDQVRNPHLIFPGQILVLEKSGDRARLRVGQPVGPDGTVRVSPRVRGESIDNGAIASIPLHLIEPFLNEAVIFENNELERAPRIVATQEGRVLLSKGDTAYVRGELSNLREWRVFRSAKPLTDPTTREVLGYEAAYVGTAEYVRPGDTRNVGGTTEIIPATFTITGIRQEANVGDRLAPVPARDFSNYVPHAPSGQMAGQIASLYGEALSAGQNQIVALNKGARDGMERGHVLALWRDGSSTLDKTQERPVAIKLPDERHGLLFVFRVFDRMSYALILSSQDPVRVGDRFTQP
ncbi:LysM peptidoglycan-binding domain-containing protein [Methylibium rhizosphaerae]|uniref:LysM peptidoglycan-binding domain-containing protein n=1 Tax=Methylibium rhizosphaerae TaxID=2570323 RepID=UPI00112A9898|nr:LysM domain-containing protein [Methylibium rhizosphaerae]